MGLNFNGWMRLLHGSGTQSGGRRTRFLHGPGTHVRRGLCRDPRRARALCAVKTAISEIAKRLLRPHRIHTRAAGSILIERPRPRRVPGLRGGKSHRPGTSLMKPGALRPVMPGGSSEQTGPRAASVSSSSDHGPGESRACVGARATGQARH